MEQTMETSQPAPEKKKSFRKFFAIILILVLLAAAAFTYFYSKTYFNLSSQLDQMTHSNQQPPTPTPPSSS